MLTSNSAQNSSLLKLNPKIPKSRNLKNQNTTPPTEIMRDPKRGLGILSTFKNNQSESSSKSARLSADNVLQLYEQGNKEFSGKNLYNLSLIKVSLEKIKFSGAKLIQSSFAQSNLSQADFEKASLIGVVFRNTILHKAQLTEADLQDADLTNADLSNANLRNANLKDANLCGANLHNAFVKKEQIKIAKTNWKTTMPSGKRGIW
jgi:serine/threonine-protein kinase